MRILGILTLSLLGCTRPDPPSENPIDTSLPNIARIAVTVDGALEPDDRPWSREWLPAELEIQADGIVVHSGRAGIHVRGNSSADYDKKSYALETWDADDADVDVSLLGLPAEEDWVLQGPYSDKSLIRNHLAYRLSRDIGRYAARTRFVELEVNGDYRGIYVFMEKLKRGPDRIDIESGGAVFRRDWVEDEPQFIETETCGDLVEVIWPDETEGLEDRLSQVERALLARDYRQVDLESFVDHMLLVELGRNVDGYVLSTWFVLSADDTLGMGPIWDYNGSLGNADYFEAWDPEGWHYENPDFPEDNPQGFCWYEALLEDPEFLALLRSRWQLHRDGALSDEAISIRVAEAVRVLEPALSRNFEQWPVLGTYVWPNDAGFADRTTHADEVAYLEDWLRTRTAWMDTALSTP